MKGKSHCRAGPLTRQAHPGRRSPASVTRLKPEGHAEHISLELKREIERRPEVGRKACAGAATPARVCGQMTAKTVSNYLVAQLASCVKIFRFLLQQSCLHTPFFRVSFSISCLHRSA